MIERYLHILNSMLEHSKDTKIDIYMQLLLTPLEIKKQGSRKCLLMAERYMEVARKYSENPSDETKANMEEIIEELKTFGEA